MPRSTCMLRPRRVFTLLLLGLTGLLATGCDSGVPPGEETGAAPTVVEFASSGLTLSEDDGPASLDVVLRNPDGQRVTVDVLYAVAASSTDPEDLGLAPTDANGVVVGTVAFPADAADGATRTLTFDIADTDDTEPRETARFALQNLQTAGTATLGETRSLRIDIGFPTVAEVREEFGDGAASFTVQGVVTRVEDDFTYIQDDPAIVTGEIGGLTIRQTGGDFANDSRIVPGARIQVTGIISYFNGLAQINNDNLLSYSVISEGGSVPAPQVVTLGELQNNGEAYEAELLRVDEGFTIDPGGDTVFQSGGAEGNYDITSPTGALIFRVPGGSPLGGEPIPTGTVAFEGVMIQFNGAGFGEDEPDTGYQLLGVRAEDLIVTP